MKLTDKVKNVTSTIISNFWGTLERINFDFTFNNGKTVNLTHEVYGKNDGIAILLYNPKTKKYYEGIYNNKIEKKSAQNFFN